jgi:hypothetical protein
VCCNVHTLLFAGGQIIVACVQGNLHRKAEVKL